MARTTTKKSPARKASTNSGNGARTRAKAGTRVPEISGDEANRTIELLQGRLVALLDLHLTLKHAHWNVTGPNFIAVHEMLDPQVAAVRSMSDAVAERIATCGGTPRGTPGAIVEGRSWNDYDIGRASTTEHLQKLDEVYQGVCDDHRSAIEDLEELDPVSEDLLTGQLGELELFAWFIRSHLAG
ncbi:MAG TPA: DNA starvation/stationary phase protection protein Dps [Microthrixaceae bacterium]|nr:DNA starvation/stationary phase protection protein Dps [Microthrixaceae bacterium]